MKDKPPRTPELFELFLRWLDPDPKQASDKYMSIELRLVKLFTCRGRVDPEGLAKEAIDRVILRVEEIVPTYVGDPALYFFGVARMMLLEPDPQPQPLPKVLVDEVPKNREAELECLDRCLEKLSQPNRELVRRYYEEEKRAKINNRQALADEFGIALNALRIRAHRIRSTLQKCVLQCLEGQPAN